MLSRLSVVLLASVALGSVVRLQDTVQNGPVVIETTSIPHGLDHEKLSPGPGKSSYDWWYFDAVSASSNESIVIVFYESGPSGFINEMPLGPLSVGIYGSFANGSAFSYEVPATCGAVIKENADSISASWEESGCRFTGTGLLGNEPQYTVHLNVASLDIKGSMVLRSRASSHYPCGPNVQGETEELLPHVFWSNAVPDAVAAVDLSIGGDKIRFYDGVGYHDKNWGDAPFVAAVSSWYWGHAELGPYSLVWFDIISSASVEYFSGYVSKNGVVLSSSCTASTVVVRPWGLNSDYPPTAASGVPQGLEIHFDLGHGENLTANVTTGLVVDDVGVYVRALASVTGGIDGSGKQYSGRALFEEFKFTGA